MLTPLSAKKRENAHFCFTSCSFFVEPRGKVVQNLEICPAHPWIRVDHTVYHLSTTTPSKTPLFDGFELPHARTPPKGVAIPGRADDRPLAGYAFRDIAAPYRNS